MTRILLLLSTVLLFASCRKADRDNDRSTSESVDFLWGQHSLFDTHLLLAEAIELESGLRSNYSLLNCANIMIDTMANPKQVLIDFGAQNCTGPDGRMRRGKVFATLTDHLRDSLCQISITTQDYYLNDRKVEGILSLTNKGRNSAGTMWFQSSISGGRIFDVDQSRVINLSASFSMYWINGINNQNPTDDLFLLSGSFSGAGRMGNTFSAQTETSLTLSSACREIISGTLSLTPENLNKRTIDFGNGTCDGVCSVLVNGFNEELTIAQ